MSEHPNFNLNRIKKVYKGMKERCNNPNHVGYKYYGAKGVKVLCTKEEFIEWYLDNVTEEIIRPNVDRIDPSGNYEISNMQLLSATENSKKALFESDTQAWEVKYNNMKRANEDRAKEVTIDSVTYPSIREAARNTGCCRKAISKAISKNSSRELKTVIKGSRRYLK